MKYSIVQADKAREWWFGWRNACVQDADRVSPPRLKEVEQRECEGPQEFNDAVLGVMEKLAALYGEVNAQNSGFSDTRFEAEASVIMHRDIPECDALGDPEFWIWCASVGGPQLISRRYPLSMKDRESLRLGSAMVNDVVDEPGAKKKKLDWIPDKANFFSSSARESFFYRLWIRGRLGFFESESDPYNLARCGDVDFWRSHIFRQQSLEAEPLRAEFIRFQFPDGPAGGPRLSQSKIRELIKRMRRAAANVVVDGLDQQQARKFIMRQWREIDG